MKRISKRSAVAALAAATLGLVLLAAGTARVAAQQGAAQHAQQQGDQHGILGFTDTPMLPNQPWHVHDINRPHPPVVKPGTCSAPDAPGKPPSDAIVLFDGKDLSNWTRVGAGNQPAGWKVENGYMEETPGTGSIHTKMKLGTGQYHVEWAAPSEIKGYSQDRGNSGVILMDRYEIQVLDPWNNPTYADGQAAAIYGQWPPLANAGRRPGEWETYDIIFEAPKFDGGKLITPAYETVIWNGVVVHNHQAPIGAMVYRKVATYTAHADAEPLQLQEHGTKTRFRNIWYRPLGHYDQHEKK